MEIILEKEEENLDLGAASMKSLEGYDEFPDESSCFSSSPEDNSAEASTKRILKRLKLSDSPPSPSLKPSTMPHTRSFYLNRNPNRHRKARSVSFSVTKSDNSPSSRFLESRRCSLNTGVANGMTPLMFAARDGDAVRTAKLLEVTQDPSLVDKRGFDALMYAVRDGNAEVAKLILGSKRAKVNTRTKHGLTHVLYAAINGHANCIQVLVEGLTLEEKKNLVNIADNSGFTPLMGAAQNGHIDTVELLVNCGAELEVKDCHGMTALFWAVTANMVEVVDKLVSLGADVNTKERKDKSPLLYAIVKSQTIMAKLLLKHKAQVDANVRMYCLMDRMKQDNLKKKWAKDRLKAPQHR